jgi:thioredoxin reductase
MAILTDTIPVSVHGEMFVKSLKVKNAKTGEERDLPAGGIFVEIGALPATGLVQGLVEMDEFNHIKVDPRTQATSAEGVWAAGDCTDGLYHQNNIAAGDAVKALEDIYLFIKARG